MTCCYFWSQQTFGHLLCLCICTSLRTEKARNLIWNEYLKSKSWMVQRFNKIFTIHFFTIWMQTVFKASWSAASSTVSKPKAWEKLGCVRMPWILVRLQALEYALCTTPTLKIQSGRYLSASSIFLLFPGNVLQTFLAQRNVLVATWSEIPNQTLQVKRWLKEPAKLGEFNSLIYMSFHKQTLLESLSQTCDGDSHAI